VGIHQPGRSQSRQAAKYDTCPSGAGIDAGPGANFYNRNLTMAYLIGADLTGAAGYYANLSNADLSQANLTNATLRWGELTGANFSNAEVRGARFTRGSTYGGPLVGGITLAQLYSTASYAAHDLSGIVLEGNDLYGANLSNVTGATLDQANLANADLSHRPVGFVNFFKNPVPERRLCAVVINGGPRPLLTVNFQAGLVLGLVEVRSPAFSTKCYSPQPFASLPTPHPSLFFKNLNFAWPMRGADCACSFDNTIRCGRQRWQRVGDHLAADRHASRRLSSAVPNICSIRA
jgi:hypothetical protein